LSAYLPEVKLSVKSDYAARAVLGLARHYPDTAALRMEVLAEEQRVPPKYLPQILLELKGRGLLRSLRGKEGGYLLARPPAEITLGEVLRAVSGPVFDAPALGNSDAPPELRRAWQKLQRALEDAAEAITFQQLLEEGAAKEKMYYI
jgi:Rrf2 family protein